MGHVHTVCAHVPCSQKDKKMTGCTFLWKTWKAHTKSRFQYFCWFLLKHCPNFLESFWNLVHSVAAQRCKRNQVLKFQNKRKNQSQNPRTKQVSTKVNSRVSKILYEKSKVLILSFHFKFQYLIPFIPLCTHWVHKVSEVCRNFDQHLSKNHQKFNFVEIFVFCKKSNQISISNSCKPHGPRAPAKSTWFIVKIPGFLLLLLFGNPFKKPQGADCRPKCGLKVPRSVPVDRGINVCSQKGTGTHNLCVPAKGFL